MAQGVQQQGSGNVMPIGERAMRNIAVKALSTLLITALVSLGAPASAWAAVSPPRADRSSTEASAQQSPRSLPRSLARGAHEAPRRGVATARNRDAAGSSTPSATTDGRAAAKQPFSPEERRRYAEADEREAKSERYEGGVTVVVGGGVLIVALIVILVIVLID